jgi:hypothetical protein
LQQTKRHREVIAILLILATAANAQNRLDTGFLGGHPPEGKASPTPDPRAKVSNRSKAIALEEKRADSKAQAESIATINSLTLILRNTQPGVARNKLLLNHATALNLFARLKILASKSSTPTEEIKKYLSASLKDVEEVLGSPFITADQKWRSHDIAGTSALYLDEEQKAREHFLQVLALNPPADKAGRIGLMIAEDLFDQGKFKEATEYYTRYYSKMNAQLKELALYKLGWCMINLDEPDQAENYLARVARSKSTSGVGKDAIRDLAYLTTHRTNPMSSILRVESILKDPVDKLAFLYDVRVALEGQGSIVVHSQIVERLLRMETNKEKRLELILANLRVQRKLYASRDHMSAFMRVPEALKTFDEKERPKVFAKFESVIELEIQNLMRPYIDTYAGRTKTNEAMTQAQIGEALKKQFEFYYRYFSNKPNFPLVVSIWRDVCLDMKDWMCVDEVSQVVLSRPDKLASMAEKAYLDQIAALDQFLMAKNGPNHKAYFDRRAIRVKEFIDKFPQSKDWIMVAKIYTQSEMESGHEVQALPVLGQIMDKEPNEDNFYRLQYARFKLKQYTELLAEPRSKKYVQDGSKVTELYRESSLILAQQAKEKSDVEQYKFYVNNFIGLSTDPAKARIARLDYLSFLLTKEMVPDAVKEYFSLPKDEIKLPEYEPFRIDLWKATVNTGNFDLSRKVAAASEEWSRKPDDWRQRRLLSAIFLGYAPKYDEMAELPASQREYFLGMLALTKPGYVIDYYHKKGRPAEKEILAVAFKIQLNQFRLIRTSQLEEIFGKAYPFAEKVSNNSLAVEKQLESITFPDLSKMSSKRQQNMVQNNIEVVRDSRKKVIKGIQGRAPETQLRTLEKARDVEAKMGEYLSGSPLPKELAPEQVEQYKKALQDAAKEFTDQSAQFELLAAKVREELKKDQTYVASRLLPQPEMDKWVYPIGSKEHAQLKHIFTLSQANNTMGAAALLDYFRPTLLKKDDDFFSIRCGVLLTGNQTDALRVYLLDELERNKQFGIIKMWAQTVNKPIPGVQ